MFDKLLYLGPISAVNLNKLTTTFIAQSTVKYYSVSLLCCHYVHCTIKMSKTTRNKFIAKSKVGFTQRNFFLHQGAINIWLNCEKPGNLHTLSTMPNRIHNNSDDLRCDCDIPIFDRDRLRSGENIL